MLDTRITFRLTPQDEIAANIIRDYLRQSDPWVDRTAVMRFALRETLDRLQAAHESR